MENHSRCPNCGRALTENALFCYFCEPGLPELEKEDKKEKLKKSALKSKNEKIIQTGKILKNPEKKFIVEKFKIKNFCAEKRGKFRDFFQKIIVGKSKKRKDLNTTFIIILKLKRGFQTVNLK